MINSTGWASCCEASEGIKISLDNGLDTLATALDVRTDDL